MAIIDEKALAVHMAADIKQLQQLGWAARAVELAQQPCAEVDTAFNSYIDARSVYEGMDERSALLNLAACCLARLWEIR